MPSFPSSGGFDDDALFGNLSSSKHNGGKRIGQPQKKEAAVDDLESELEAQLAGIIVFSIQL